MDARSRDMLASPDDALRFARGEAIGFGPFDADGRGTRARRLARPLDFAAVTDHAEWIGEVSLCTTEGSVVWDSDACQRFRGERTTRATGPGLGFASRMTAVMGLGGRPEAICGEDAGRCRAALRNAWQETRRATERWHDASPACRFTAFHGWEHSRMDGLSKIHRNVIFRNASVPELPISSLEAPEAGALWDRLDALCTDADTGCEVLTIPHNPNVSNGRLYAIEWRDAPRAEQVRRARQRARLEPLLEMMQVKGESECRNGLFDVVGGADELCGFEKIRSFAGASPTDCEEGVGAGAIRGAGCQSRVDFARYAVVAGLREAERIGVDPYRVGFVGSTDGHNANPGDVDERDWGGCCANDDAEPAARLSTRPAFAGAGAIARNPGGLMGVWAEENSRDALFDAMQRRETFATSGPRITPRFFGGWGLGREGDLCGRPDLVALVDSAGVPMGGVLDASPAHGDARDMAPTFVAHVARDPGSPGRPGGRLDRLQIVKVWHDEDGRFHQAVHDVAGRVAASDRDGARAPSGAAPPAPPRVDLATCEPEDAKAGADQLCAVWQDPDFDPDRAAAWYVRAVENPSCRWSWWTCLGLPEDERPAGCRDPAIPKTIQERAWTSPIWYAPSPTPGA